MLLPFVFIGLTARVAMGNDRFDVISIRQTSNPSPIRKHSSERIDYEGISMPQLIEKAFGLPEHRIVWPDWVNVVRFRPNKVKPDVRFFAISATMPSSTTDEDFKRMLQNLLVERFGLVFHRETRPTDEYEMTFVAGGPKMQVAKPAGPGRPDFADDENPAAAGRNFNLSFGADGMRVKGDMTLQQLASLFSQYLWHPITEPVDFGQYYAVDFLWFWNPYSLPPPLDGMATNRASEGETRGLFSEMGKRLGIKLILRSVPREVVVIDQLNHESTEN